MQEESIPGMIGKYKILSILGTGAMGTVYKAEDPEIGRTVAIKVIKVLPSNPYMDEKSCLDRFRIEARSAGSLRHSHIVTIFDVNTEAKPPYLVMDHIDGIGLDRIIESSGRLDPYDVVHYLYQIAQGLDYAHGKGIIHRDIKPSNILVDSGGHAYMLDFGVATISGHSHFDENSPIIGSPAYMAPEQILNEELDNRADIFSLAVVAFECFTGHRPFGGDNFTIVARQIIKGEHKSLDNYVDGLPLTLETEFEKALARDKKVRFRSACMMMMVFCDALGIKNPTGGTASMRGYHYQSGGDPKSDVFKDVAPTKDTFKVDEPSSVTSAVRKNFGAVKPVTAAHEFWSSVKVLIGIFLLLLGALILYISYYEPAVLNLK